MFWLLFTFLLITMTHAFGQSDKHKYRELGCIFIVFLLLPCETIRNLEWKSKLKTQSRTKKGVCLYFGFWIKGLKRNLTMEKLKFRFFSSDLTQKIYIPLLYEIIIQNPKCKHLSAARHHNIYDIIIISKQFYSCMCLNISCSLHKRNCKSHCFQTENGQN